MEPREDPIRIILVQAHSDDTASFERDLRQIAGRPIRTIRCQGVADTLATLDSAEWDAIILDLSIGLDEAIGFLSGVQNAKGAPPVIVTSDHYEREDDLACMRAGAAEFLVKTKIDPEILERVLRYTLRQADTARHLEESLQLRDHFLSLLAHDVRGPLAVLASGLELYNRRFSQLPAEKIQKFLLQAEEQVRQIQGLTSQVLDWASSQSPDFHPHRTQFSFTECMDAVMQTLNPLADAKSIRIRIPTVEGIHLRMDRNMLEAILRNLITNAIKFSEPESTVEVLFRQNDGDFMILVKDQGIGMEDALRQNLLAGRLIEVRRGTGNEKGSGLGLRLCLRYAQLHQGHLEIDSEEGKGTQVSVVLPGECMA